MRRQLVAVFAFASILAAQESRAATTLQVVQALSQATLGEPISIVAIAPAAAGAGPVGWIALGGVAAVGGGYLLYNALTDDSASVEAETNARLAQGQRDLDQWQADSKARRQGARNAQELEAHRRRLESEHRQAAAARDHAADRLREQVQGTARSLPGSNQALATAAHDAHQTLAEKVARHNVQTERVAERLRSAEGAEPQAEEERQQPPSSQPPRATGVPPSPYQTHPHDPGYNSLEKSDRYIASAYEAVTAAVPPDRAQVADLGIATLALHQADGRYSVGDVATGDGIVAGLQSLVDDVLDYAHAKDRISRGSTFLAGVINGASGGLLPQRILPGYESTYHVGRLVGAGIGLTADGVAMVAGAAGVAGSGGAAAMTGGILALPAIVVATESAALATSGAIAATTHGATILDAVRNMAMEGGPASDSFPTIDRLLKGANAPDRNGLSKAGRSLQKHGSRAGSSYPPGTGSVAPRNQAGAEIVEAILRDPQATRIWHVRGRFGRVMDIRLPNGKGARFDEHGVLIHFLEPYP
jgi:hypothetical protein